MGDFQSVRRSKERGWADLGRQGITSGDLPVVIVAAPLLPLLLPHPRSGTCGDHRVYDAGLVGGEVSGARTAAAIPHPKDSRVTAMCLHKRHCVLCTGERGRMMSHTDDSFHLNKHTQSQIRIPTLKKGIKKHVFVGAAPVRKAPPPARPGLAIPDKHPRRTTGFHRHSHAEPGCIPAHRHRDPDRGRSRITVVVARLSWHHSPSC